MSKPLNGCVRSHASTGQNVPRRNPLSRHLSSLEESTAPLTRQLGRIASDSDKAAEFGAFESNSVLCAVSNTLEMVADYVILREDGLTSREASRVVASIDLATMMLELLEAANDGAEEARKRRGEVGHEE